MLSYIIKYKKYIIYALVVLFIAFLSYKGNEALKVYKNYVAITDEYEKRLETALIEQEHTLRLKYDSEIAEQDRQIGDYQIRLSKALKSLEASRTRLEELERLRTAVLKPEGINNTVSALNDLGYEAMIINTVTFCNTIER